MTRPPAGRVGTCRLDLNLRYVEINPWLAHINGLSVEEHIGKTIGEILPDVAEMVEEQLQHVISEGAPLLKGQAYAETPAHPGLKRLYQHDYFPVKNDKGTVVGVTCVVRDITRRWLHKEIPRIKNEIRLLEAYELAGPEDDSC